MILSTPCAKKRKCRICTNKRTAALTSKPRFAEPGFAVWLKQRHCLPAFTRSEEAGILFGWISDDRTVFLVCAKLISAFFSVFLPVPPGKNFFSAPQKITSRPHTFAATGERSFRRSDPVFFRKRRCRDFFHQIIGQQNAVPLRLLFFQYPIARFSKNGRAVIEA